MTLQPRYSDRVSPGRPGPSNTRVPSPTSGEPAAAGGLGAGIPACAHLGMQHPRRMDGRALVHPALCPSCSRQAPRRRAVCPMVPASSIIRARCPEHIPRCQPWRWRRMGCFTLEKKHSILAPLLANWLHCVLDLCLGPRRTGTTGPQILPGPRRMGTTGPQALLGPRRMGTTGPQALPPQAHRPFWAL